MLIERPPLWFRRLFPGALFRLEQPEGVKRVFLTFDDGPIPEATPWVLNQLEKYGLKATFFMVGENARRYPELLEEVRKHGHQIGNHTLHHIRGAGISAEEYMQDVKGCNELKDATLFRPPHGWLTPAQFREIKKNYRVVMYDLVTRDYSRKVSAEDVVNNIRKFTRPGSIIVFHDSLKSIDKLKTALPDSIEWLFSRGYEFGLI